MGTLTYPYSLTAGEPENVNNLNSNLTAIANVLNGGVDTTNLSGSAGITDAQLASPNNTVIRSLGRWLVATNASYVVGGSDMLSSPTGGLSASGSASGIVPYLHTSALAVAGKTLTLMYSLVVQYATPKPAFNIEVGLKQVTVSGSGITVVWSTTGAFLGTTYSAVDPAAGTQQLTNVAALSTSLTAGNFYMPVFRLSGGSGTAQSQLYATYELFAKFA